jgi:(2Fe-2S) ferredoxin
MRKDEQKSAFVVEGRFLGFAARSDAKLKYVRLATATGEYLIKMPKDQRQMLYRQLVPGDWLQASGWRKQDGRTSTWKADMISRATAGAANPTPAAAPAIAASTGKPACILFCQKSDCCKKGAQRVAAALENEIEERGLNVTVKGTGCMKQCKAGPAIVMPDKTRYTRIGVDAVPKLVDKHFPQPTPASEAVPAPCQAIERVTVTV